MKRATSGAFVIALFAGACGVTGSTSRFTVELPIKSAHPIVLASIELEPHAAQLTNFGTYAWGKYSAEDLANLEASLRDTFAEASGPEVPPANRVHVVVRSHLITSSNTMGGMLSCVAWAYVDREDRLLFQEQFYATGSAVMENTLGGLKDELHEAIVRRIAATSLRLASGSLEHIEPARVEHTYDTFEEAQETVPRQLTALIARGGFTKSRLRVSYTEGQREPMTDWAAKISPRAADR